MGNISTALSEGSLAFLEFLEKLINIFIVPEMGMEIRQGVRVVILLMLTLAVIVFSGLILRLLKDAIKPLIESLGGKVEYLFYTLLALLVFLFSKQPSFGGACFAIFCIILIGQIHAIVKTSLEYAEKKTQKHVERKD